MKMGPTMRIPMAKKRYNFCDLFFFDISDIVCVNHIVTVIFISIEQRRFPRRQRFRRQRGSQEPEGNGDDKNEGDEGTGDDGAAPRGNGQNGRRRRYVRRNFRGQRKSGKKIGFGTVPECCQFVFNLVNI